MLCADRRTGHTGYGRHNKGRQRRTAANRVRESFGHPFEKNAMLSKRDQVLIGYRYVAQKQTGQGAYISPGLGQWETNPQYWQCRILADRAKFKAAPKLFVADKKSMGSDADLTEYLSSLCMDQATTLLFSRIKGKDFRRQLLIPPYYLRRSYVPGKAATTWGNGDLGIVAQFIGIDPSTNADSPVADWETDWAIPGWKP
ncbi:hypothetical protein C8R43DRAFT_958789 [Mycena crocata]|nr:hypothetical protein C8R43DRAFT_958789 [Mycena crocata]